MTIAFPNYLLRIPHEKKPVQVLGIIFYMAFP